MHNIVEKGEDDDGDQQIRNVSYTTGGFSLCTVPVSLLSVCMVCLLGTQDAYTLTCGRSSQLKKKQQNTNASTWLGNH